LIGPRLIFGVPKGYCFAELNRCAYAGIEVVLSVPKIAASNPNERH
jgi:hypothetical protein